jgi:hypothetical protein
MVTTLVLEVIIFLFIRFFNIVWPRTCKLQEFTTGITFCIISICWYGKPNISTCIICRVGSESLILGTMWCRRYRLCCLELIGQRIFLTQLMDSWPLN